MTSEHGALLGQMDATPAAFKQRYVEDFLELANGLGHRGLGDRQALGRAVHAAETRYLDEAMKVTDLHRAIDHDSLQRLVPSRPIGEKRLYLCGRKLILHN